MKIKSVLKDIKQTAKDIKETIETIKQLAKDPEIKKDLKNQEEALREVVAEASTILNDALVEIKKEIESFKTNVSTIIKESVEKGVEATKPRAEPKVPSKKVSRSSKPTPAPKAKKTDTSLVENVSKALSQPKKTVARKKATEPKTQG